MSKRFSESASINPSSMISWNTSFIGLPTIPTRPSTTDLCIDALTTLTAFPSSFFPLTYRGILHCSKAEKKLKTEKKLKIKYEEYRDQEFFANDYQKRWDEIILWIFALYSSGYIFSFNEIEILTPWWIWNPLESLSFPPEPWSIIKPCSIHDFKFFGISHFEEKYLSRIRNYYSLIKCSKILNNKDFTLIISRYFRMFDINSIQDRILSAYILLESIFTSQSRGEVTFKLPLNIALFLPSNDTEFSDIYEFTKTFYDIQSKIAHGNEWLSFLTEKKTNKIKKKYLKFFDEEIQENPGLLCVKVFKTLKDYIDRSLLKIMCWQLIHNNESYWKKTENGLFFLKNRLVS